MPLLKEDQHREIAFWGLAMIAMGLPLSIFLMSVGVFVLIGNWLLEGNYLQRLKRFFTDPLSLAISSLFLIYVVGLIWTQDFAMGFKELKSKVPLVILPLTIFTSRLPSKKRLYDILLVFVVACLVGVLFGMARLFELSGDELLDKRKISVFISHIRFGLMLVMAFFILVYFLYAKWKSWSVTEKVLTMASMLWIVWFLAMLEAFTSFAAFGVALAIALVMLFTRKFPSRLKLAAAGIISVVFVLLGIWASSIVENRFHKVPSDYLTQHLRTLSGNFYEHNTSIPYRENGHRVWDYVCWKELHDQWPNRSDFDFNGLDKKGQEIKYTTIRYMTSKGLKKDSAGVSMLTKRDIQNIESGYTNYRYTTKLGIARRFDQILWAIEQYTWNENANNSSTIQRWVYLDVGLGIWKDNLVLGVGTGDVQKAYKDAYQADNRGLEQRFQGISHNQYLTIGIALGTVGLIIFFISIFYPLFLYRRDFLYVVFITLMLVSFMTDNTFNRQAGVILFGFFNSLLIARREFSETED
ncbi:MAG: O-antigen ligase family protein [Flavobacteriales bacterium]|nr:O-antigen ligase family protein [Flavobacteriales bacterium]MCB9203673.1 O-antigen ligase family protein [Flavobacteriales bacterium]